ncbi:NTF2 fold immunity protein [Ferruginibacter sp.]
MEFEKYINGCIDDAERTPEITVIEFVNVFNKWAKDCHNFVKADRDKLKELTRKDSEARKILKQIYAKYCTLKNRKNYRTSNGYYFYGGTYNAGSELEKSLKVSNKIIEVFTLKIKNISPSRKYTVIKKGQIWKIDTVENLIGNGKWNFDLL